MKIFKSFLNSTDEQTVYDVLTDPKFIWDSNENTTVNERGGVFIDQYTKTVNQYTNLAYSFSGFGFPLSSLYGVAELTVKRLEEITGENYFSRLHRIKANMLLIQDEHNYPYNFYNTPHVDIVGEDSISLLYYVNDSDGDTFMFNECESFTGDSLSLQHREPPERNKAVLFDSSKFHSSSSPRKHDKRIVINVVFKK
jgi:hypothetical protein